MRHRIEVDDDVYKELQRRAIPFKDKEANDVLRRELLPGTAAIPPVGATGELIDLIKAGHLKPGDILLCHQPRKRRTFRAEVTDDGFIKINDGRKIAHPSPALKAYVGHEISGWKYWIVERTGRPLQDYR